VFGNPDLKKDSLVVGLVGRLRRKFPGVEFRVEDPGEGLKPPKDGLWVILDVAEGIDRVRVFEKVDKLVEERGVSLHDYEVGTELKLLKKLGKIRDLKIMAVPMKMEEKELWREVVKKLKEVIPKELHRRY